MNAAFTPGPWRLQKHAKLGGTQMYWVNERTSVGTQVEQDALLIAAAPEMFKLIADIEESLTADNTYRLLREACRKVIAKATDAKVSA